MIKVFKNDEYWKSFENMVQANAAVDSYPFAADFQWTFYKRSV